MINNYSIEPKQLTHSIKHSKSVNDLLYFNLKRTDQFNSIHWAALYHRAFELQENPNIKPKDLEKMKAMTLKLIENEPDLKVGETVQIIQSLGLFRLGDKKIDSWFLQTAIKTVTEIKDPRELNIFLNGIVHSQSSLTKDFFNALRDGVRQNFTKEEKENFQPQLLSHLIALDSEEEEFLSIAQSKMSTYEAHELVHLLKSIRNREKTTHENFCLFIDILLAKKENLSSTNYIRAFDLFSQYKYLPEKLLVKFKQDLPKVELWTKVHVFSSIAYLKHTETWIKQEVESIAKSGTYKTLFYLQDQMRFGKVCRFYLKDSPELLRNVSQKIIENVGEEYFSNAPLQYAKLLKASEKQG